MLRDQRLRGRRKILNSIREANRVARIDIAQETGISQATVTTVTAEMLREGLIEEVPRSNGSGESKRGRPRVALKIRGDAHFVAGVKVANNSMSVAIMDFEGELLGEFNTSIQERVSPARNLAVEIRTAVERACAESNLALTQLSAVGVGLAGVIDATKGMVHWSPSLNSRKVDFGKVLREIIELPVFLDNDANTVATAEQYFGHGKGVSDFLVITIESGVGLGVVLGGEIYRGTRGCGAEFGHTKVHLDGALCRCGQRGCLEAYVADYALLREASVAGMFAKDDTVGNKIQLLLDRAYQGEALPRSIIDRAGRMFAMGLANLVNIFDPELIILSGERIMADHLYAETVIDSIKDSIVQIDLPPPKVVIHKWGDSMWARGAAAYALQEVAKTSLEELGGHVE